MYSAYTPWQNPRVLDAKDRDLIDVEMEKYPHPLEIHDSIPVPIIANGDTHRQS